MTVNNTCDINSLATRSWCVLYVSAQVLMFVVKVPYCNISYSVTKSCLTLSTPWTAAHQASLSFTISWSLLRFMSTELVIPSNHLLFCHTFSCPQSFPASGSFPVSQLFISADQRIGVSVAAAVLPMNIQGCFPLRLTGLKSLLSKGLLKVFSSTTVQKHQFF